MKKYPIRPVDNRQRSIVPCSPPMQNVGVPSSIIPMLGGNNRNVAGQIRTIVYLEDKNGNKMTIKQQQQLLNLIDGAKGNWSLQDDTRHANRRKK